MTGSRRQSDGRRAAARAAAVLPVMLLSAGPSVAAEASAWAPSRHSAARLIDAGPARPDDPAPSGGRLVGVEVRLDAPFITYWRNPGDAGVPPRFDFAGSENVADARVLYPVPQRLDEDGSAAFGYTEGVTFPIGLTPKDPARPMTAVLVFDYAVCAKICLPAEARLRLDLTGEAGPEAEVVRAGLAAVPTPARLGGAGPLRIEGLEPGREGTLVRAATPDGTGTLFVEAPEPWYVEASPARPDGAGQVTFTLSVPGSPPPGPVPKAPLRLTLAGPNGAIEVAVPLDEAIPRP